MGSGVKIDKSRLRPAAFSFLALCFAVSLGARVLPAQINPTLPPPLPPGGTTTTTTTTTTSPTLLASMIANVLAAMKGTPRTANGWTQIDGGKVFTNASIGSASTFGGTAGYQSYSWNGTSFVSDAMILTQVAIGKDGDRWGVVPNYQIVHRATTTNWTIVPGTLKQVSAGSASNVWGVNSGSAIYKWTGTTWTQMPGSALSVSAAADGTVLVLTSSDQVYKWNGSGWLSMPGTFRWISVGSATNVWGVNAAGSVYRLNTTGSWDMPVVPSGTFVGVSTASDGTTLLVGNDGTLWKR